MTFSDLLKEIIDSSKERLKTPIAGAYVLSFTLWNWRPIALLLFENATVTQKIIIVNTEYCNLMALIGPLLLGLFFTTGIPYMMVIIDNILQPAKRSRLKTIYKAKTNELDEQIDLVEKELKLQDKKNRSKTTEDFEVQITELQNRLETTNDSHRTVIDGYKQQIKDLTSVIQKNNDDREADYNFYLNQKELNDFINLMIQSDFHPQDFQFARHRPLDTTTIFDNSIVANTKAYSFLSRREFIETINSGFRYTEKGIRFMTYIKEVLESDNGSKTPNSFLNPNVD